jgi:hypothetical protein
MRGEHTVNLPVIEVEVIELQRNEIILVSTNCAYFFWKVCSDQSDVVHLACQLIAGRRYVLKFVGYTIMIDGVAQRW